ncbi:MAG: hypothetical protein GY869_31820, partial [Planctomycetes bacterium]|nr:hypothetical protein [Planctomycetota bacterium]
MGFGYIINWHVTFSPTLDGVYYAKIRNSVPLFDRYFLDSGEGTDYKLMLTLPEETFDGFIYGQVTPAAETLLTTTGKGEAITDSDGYFFMPHVAGEFGLNTVSPVCPTHPATIIIPEKTPVKLGITLRKSDYIITASSGSNGIIWPSGPVAVCDGMSVAFTMIPEYGYKVEDVIVDGVSEGAVASYSFDNVTADHAIDARFYSDAYDKYEDDDTYERANVLMVNDQDPVHQNIPGYVWRQLHDFHNIDDEDWVKFYAHVRDEPYTLSVTFPGANCDAAIGIYESDGQTSLKYVNNNERMGMEHASFSPSHDGLYYAKISNSTPFYGQGTDYVLMLTLPAGTFDGFIYGLVTPAVETVLNSTSKGEAIADSDGYYFMPHLAGEFELTAIASGCQTYISKVAISENELKELDILLSAKSSTLITTNAGLNGTISPSGPVTVCEGMSQTFTIKPNYGYTVEDVIVDGFSEGAIASYTFDNVIADHTIDANFNSDPYDKYEDDDTYESANFLMLNDQDPDHQGIPGYEWRQFHDFHDRGDEDWVKFYAHVCDEPYTISTTYQSYSTVEIYASDGQTLLTPKCHIFCKGTTSFSPPLDGLYYARIKADNSSEYGIGTEYELMVTSPIGTFDGFIYGKVTPAVETVLSTNGKGWAITDSDGRYFMPHIAGVFDLTAKAANPTGCQSYETTVSIPDKKSLELNITLRASGAYIITPDADPNGTIVPSGSTPVCDGMSQTFTIWPGSGWRVEDVIVDGAAVGAVETYTFDDVSTDHKIEAYFKSNFLTITAMADENGKIEPSGSVTIAHNSYQIFKITPDNLYAIADIKVDGASVEVGATYTFNNVTTDHIIEVSFTDLKHIISSTTGPNGLIAPSGETPVAHGLGKTFSITPDEGYAISDVKVDGISVGAVTSYTFDNVIAEHIIEASFTDYSHIIFSTAGPNGAVAPSGETPVAHGLSQVFTITPDDGYAIEDVKVDGSFVDSDPAYIFENILTDHTIEASFTDYTHTIAATAGPNGSIEPSGEMLIAHGASRIFTITPDDGYAIDNVVVKCESAAADLNVGADPSYTFENIDKDCSIEASFKERILTINAHAGENGKIDPPGLNQYDYGQTRTFSITPNDGYAIRDLKVNGVSKGAKSRYTFVNISEDYLIEARFGKTRIITTSVNSGGALTPSGTVEVAEGNNQTFTITPEEGYTIAKVIVDGSTVEALANFTFNNVAVDHKIEVLFAKIIHTINAGTNPNGTISPSGLVNVGNGGGKFFTITPDPGSQIVDVRVDDLTVAADGWTVMADRWTSQTLQSYTFENVTADHTIEASFSNNTIHTVKATAGSNGTINPAGQKTVPDGNDRAFSITPDDGYAIANVKVDGYSIGPVAGCNLRAVAANHTIGAIFGIKRTVTASVNARMPNGSIAPSGPVSVADGGAITFTITPDNGYQIADAKKDGVIIPTEDIDSVNGCTNYSITAFDNHSIEASFSRKVYTITASAKANGRISPSGSVAVAHGAGRTFTITPDIGFEIASVKKDGVIIPAEAILNVNGRGSYTITVADNHKIEASFTGKSYTIIPITKSNGQIEPDGSTSIEHGAVKSLEIIPDSGYAVEDVTVNDVSIGPVRSYTFEDIANDYKIVASFKVGKRTISSSAKQGGSISPSGEVLVAHGVSQTFTIAPDPGYAIFDVKVDEISQGAEDSHTYSDVNDDSTIEASFTDDWYTITTATNPGENLFGKISPPGPVAVAHGASPEFKIVPEPGYEIADVKVDGSSFGVTRTCQFFNVTADHTIEATFKGYKITAGAGANGAILPS